MCDTLCVLSAGGTLFAKNSDRPPTEVQLLRARPQRPGGGELSTQYLRIADHGACATLLSQPTWLFGAEHGVNEHRVAIGNERVYTRLDAQAQPPALIGMDLVRLGLEGGRSAEEALEVMTTLLERHGQGGVGDAEHAEAYFSSFLVADPLSAWVLETEGRSWAARPVDDRVALSNRLSLRSDWTRGSTDLKPGEDLDRWRDPEAPTGHADRRLAAASALLAHHRVLTPAQMVAHLRDHGHGPWGGPGAPREPQAPPPSVEADFTGVSVCMHIRRYMATTSSMVALLPRRQDEAMRAWVAPGSPCASVFVPVFPPQPAGSGVPSCLGDEALWRAGAALRELVEKQPEAMGELRAALDPLEAELWAEAEEVASDPRSWPAAAKGISARSAEALCRLASSMPAA